MIIRLLHRLLPPGADTSLEVIVACNGCTDDTAAAAAGVHGVRVLETEIASKQEALRLGNRHANHFPRIYIDADVEIDRADVEELVRVVGGNGVLAAAPARVISRGQAALPVRWYYDVWENLPGVSAGIFGRGVIALSEEGFQRIERLPRFMSDDLAMSSAFTDRERVVADGATVVVHAPRTWADLLRRRVRVATGTAQAYEGEQQWATDSRTGVGDLVRLSARRPDLAAKMPVFLFATVQARRGAAAALRRGDFHTWLRDESSRS